MIVLDTDCMTILEQEATDDARRLRERLLGQGESFVCTIVSVEERMRGWLAAIASAKDSETLIRRYRKLGSLLEELKRFQVMPFGTAAAVIFDGLKARKIRVGTMDMRIASIALSQDATLVSRNLKDFKKIPGLKVEDWIGAKQ